MLISGEQQNVSVISLYIIYIIYLVAPVVKNLPAMRETQVQSLGQEDALEKGMAVPYSSILAWRIPWMEEPGGATLHGILQARILAWVAIPFSSRSSRPRD